MGAQIVGNSKSAPGSVYDYFNLMYAHQDAIHAFADTGTVDTVPFKPPIYFVANDTMLVDYVSNILKTDATFAPFAPAFAKGFKDENMDWLARVDWKFACSVGTSGTPFPYVNRVFLDQGISSFDLDDWEKIIDPMLNSEVNNVE